MTTLLGRVHNHGGALLMRPLRRGTFTFDGRRHRYGVHAYNTTWRNERTVEIPLVAAVMDRHVRGAILEVGNVMHHYGRTGHDVVDRYEPGPGVANVDIVDFRPERRYDLIVSASTLEHVGFDEDVEDPGKPVRAVRHLATLLAPGGLLFVTFPLGYNRDVDLATRENAFGFDALGYLQRVSGPTNRWHEVSADAVRRARYGLPYPAANAVAVGTLTAPGAHS